MSFNPSHHSGLEGVQGNLQANQSLASISSGWLSSKARYV